MLKANIKDQGTYKDKDLEKLNRTLALIEKTINSQKFHDAVIGFKDFQFEKYKCFFNKKVKTIQLPQYTNDELLAFLLKGQSEDQTNAYMDFKVTLSEKRGGSAIGETNANNIITTFRAAFDSMSEEELAAHLTHEWTHTMGFEHSYSNKCDKDRDCLSVPYAIGNIIEIILTGKCFYGCEYETLNTK
ncbi:hypothetical protein [Flavobacterium sp.]|uniref:hypothetical protein n=1 Tax=Flavobacterium sp. TaxID=239 RepID=UPI00391C22F1